MAWLPISLTVPQYVDANGDPYSGAVLKAYKAGTSTNISMATTSAGGATATSIALNASGNPAVSGNVVIPHISQKYKLSLYPAQSAADANTGAIWTIDNINPVNREYYSVVDYGAAGDGATDDGAAFQSAIDAAFNDGGGIVYAPANTYLIETQFSLKAGVTLEGDGAATVLQIGLVDQIMSNVGSINTSQSNTLASNASAGDTTVTLSSGKGDNFVAGDWALILDTGGNPFGAGDPMNNRGEIIRVKSVSTDTLTLDGPILIGYLTANSAEVQKITTLDNIGLKNLKIRNPDTATFTTIATEWGFCYRPTIENVIFDSNKNSAMIFQGCIGTTISNCRASDLESGASATGYFVVEAGPNVGLRMDNCIGERVRHVYTTVNGKSVAGVTVSNGYPTGSIISNCHALFPRAAGFDTHEDGVGIVFDGCTVFGGLRQGFQMRAVDVQLNNCLAESCVAGAFHFASCYRVSASNCRAYRTNKGTDAETSVDWTLRGAFYDQGNSTQLTNCWAVEVGHDGFEFADAAAAVNPIYRGCTALNIGVNNTGQGFNISSTQTTTVIMQDCIAIDDSGSSMSRGFTNGSANVTAWFNNCYSRGHSDVPIGGSSSNVNGGFNGNQIGAGIATTLTVATGVINVNSSNTAQIKLNGEGAAADDLDTINGGVEGQQIYLVKGDATVTLKDGTGNIQIVGAADFALDGAFDVAIAIKRGSTWIVHTATSIT